MAPRDIIALKLDRETPETIRSAIYALMEIALTADPKHSASIMHMRDDFNAEIRLLLDDQVQGALF